MMPTNYKGEKKCAHEKWEQIPKKLQKEMSKVYSKVHSLELHRGISILYYMKSYVNQVL